MAGNSDLVIRVLADVSSAENAFGRLTGTLGKALGIGAAAGGATAIVKTAEDYQSAMAKIQQADASFQPGTAKYDAARATIEKYSTTLATSFEDVADVMAGAAKVSDQYGNKLPIDKVNELTEASIRLSKASQGSLDSTTALQDQSMLSKIFNNQDFGGNANAIAALSQQHPQNEGTLLDAAIAIGQGGAPLGVTEAQALGLGNYLSDLGLGGQQGGSSVTRTLQRMNTASDQVLDPEQQYSDLKKHRDATEKLSDLQGQLQVAQQRHAQMFGQHGLKTAYKRDPAAVTASDNDIAKLQREIADQQQDNAHLDDAKKNPSRGAVNLASMASTAGMSVADFAQEDKDSPIQAILDFTSGVHNLPQEQREAALSKAGITNVRDIRTLMGLSDQPDSAQRQIDIASNPGSDALKTISDYGLKTTAAKQEDVGNQGRNTVVDNGGDQARQGLDALLDKALQLGKAFDDDAGKLGVFGGAMGGVVDVVGPLLAFQVVKGAASKVLGGGGKGSAVKTASESVATDVEATGSKGLFGEILAGAGPSLAMLGSVIAPAVATAMTAGSIKLGLDNPALVNYVAQGDSPYTDTNKRPTQINVNMGDVHAGSTLKEVLDAVTDQITQAWSHAQTSQPVTGQVGGTYVSGQGPR